MRSRVSQPPVHDTNIHFCFSPPVKLPIIYDILKLNSCNIRPTNANKKPNIVETTFLSCTPFSDTIITSES